MRFHASPLPAFWRLLILLPAFCCLSCSGGGKYSPVRGKVLYKNEPIQGVVVTFHPKSMAKLPDPPVGVTEEDGTFSVNTGKNAGAPAGEYVVTFYCPQQVEEKAEKKGKPRGMVMQKLDLEDRFKGAYGNEAKSEFKVVITSGKNDLDPFNLK